MTEQLLAASLPAEPDPSPDISSPDIPSPDIPSPDISTPPDNSPEFSPSPDIPDLPAEPSPPGDTETPLPIESQPGTAAGTQDAGTQVPVDTAPASTGFPGWGWAIIGLAVGLLLGVLFAKLFRRRQSPAPARAADPEPAETLAPTASPPVSTVSPPSFVPTVSPSAQTVAPAASVQTVSPVPSVQTVSLKQPEVAKLHEQGARSSQQDSFFVSPEDMYATHGLLAVVADGMGGLAAGDKVSQAVATAMMSGFYHAPGTPDQVLLVLLKQAMEAVDSLLGPDGYRQSGSTLVAGLIRNGAFHYLSVGDSHIYLWRDGALSMLNREHIFRNDLCLRAVNGEGSFLEAERHPKAGGLTSFLGMGPLKYIDLPAEPVTIRPGDRFLLMSDGVYNALPGKELEDLLNRNPERMADALLEAVRAKNYSNQDNYTAVVLRC